MSIFDRFIIKHKFPITKQHQLRIDKENELSREEDLVHPERLAVLPYCKQGLGVDVGCGHRKSSDNCVGVDVLPKDSIGMIGCISGKQIVSDVCTSGDNLSMFEDDSLDFVIARHNLEHYVDVVNTLEEWRRVLKPDGVMAIILPDEDGLNKVGKRGIDLDSTHEHSFTQRSFESLIKLLGGFEIIKLEVVVENWSFICVCKKK